MGNERSQDLVLLVPRHVELVQGARENGGDLVEFVGRDPDVPMGFLEAEDRALDGGFGTSMKSPTPPGYGWIVDRPGPLPARRRRCRGHQ